MFPPSPPSRPTLLAPPHPHPILTAAVPHHPRPHCPTPPPPNPHCHCPTPPSPPLCVPARTQEKVRIAAPKGWDIELTDFSMGTHGPVMSNFQVGGAARRAACVRLHRITPLPPFVLQL